MKLKPQCSEIHPALIIYGVCDLKMKDSYIPLWSLSESATKIMFSGIMNKTNKKIAELVVYSTDYTHFSHLHNYHFMPLFKLNSAALVRE
jgi:hypothetical protein